MSDDQMPGWALKMEERAEARDHQLLTEVAKALGDVETRVSGRVDDLRAEMNRRFDQMHDDMTVNLGRADVAIERVQRLE